ncbi:MAG: NUDIX hydrolase [Anaerolineales bacterium]
MQKFELLNTETIYRGRAFTIRRDLLRTPSGAETRFDIIEHHGSVILIPLDQAGNLIFVRQYRHAAGIDLLELPAGTLEEGEDPADCARRELREETGMNAHEILPLGSFYLAPGYSTELMHVYLARELFADPLQADADEFLENEAIPAARALEMAQNGELPDAKSLAALLLARKFL